MDPRRLVDRLTAALSVLAIVLFVVSLRDVTLTPVVLDQSTLPDPVPGEVRDAGLRARVIGRGGAAVRGAQVSVFWEQGERYHLAGRAVTDDRGTVALTDLPHGRAWVVVDAAGLARHSTPVMLGTATGGMLFELEDAHALSVAVIDDRGQPLVDATVLVHAGDALPFGALSDAAGRTGFGRLGPGPYQVKVALPGYETLEMTGVEADRTVTLRPLGSLTVTVRDGLGVVPAATVRIVSATLFPAHVTATGANGTVKISGLLAGTYDLQAVKGEAVSFSSIGVHLDRGEHRAVELVLLPGRRVTVLVAEDDDEEHPVVVANADVVLVESGLSPFPLEGRTGKLGTLVLGPVPPGPATLMASADGFVGRNAVVVPDDTSEPVRIVLRRGGVVRGVVVDSDGRAVEGATLEVVGTDLDGLPVAASPLQSSQRRLHFEWALASPSRLIPAGELGVMPGPVPAIPTAGVGAAPWHAWRGATAAPWVTASDGSFVARPVPPGRVRVIARHPEFVEGMSDVVTLAPGGEAEVRIVLDVGGGLEGRVVDAAGQPVADARIELGAISGSLTRATRSAEDGRFAFAALPPRVVLWVWRPESPTRAALREEVDVKRGAVTEVTLELPDPREPVSVLVVDERDQPVELAQVTVLSLDAEAPLRETAFTTDTGRIEVADAAGINLRVVVDAPGFLRVTTNVDPKETEHTIKLEPGLFLEGVVTAVRGRVALEGATVTLTAGGRTELRLTDARGRYRFDLVPLGSVLITVAHADYATESVTLSVTSTGRADRPFEAPPIDLSEPGRVAGVVVDLDGEPVSGARVGVGVMPAFVPAGRLPLGVRLSDSRGGFVLEGLPPGTVDIEAYAPDLGRGRYQGVKIESGETHDGVVIKLDEVAEAADATATGSVAITLGERGRGANVEVVVVHVAEGSEAEHAGLAVGDVVLEVDGVAATSLEQVRTRLSGNAGTDVVIQLLRGDDEVGVRTMREAVRR